jgi:hypothetical protein
MLVYMSQELVQESNVKIVGIVLRQGKLVNS